MSLDDKVQEQDEVIAKEKIANESSQDTVDRLARLSLAEYEFVRIDEAKRLKFRTSALDKAVSEARKTNRNIAVSSDDVTFTHLKTTSYGDVRVLATRENLERLMHHYGVTVAYDVIKKRAVITGVASLIGEEENTMVAFLKSKCALHDLSKATVDEQLDAITFNNAINPVTKWLGNIKRTCSRNPVNILVNSLNVSNKEWVRVAMYRWLIQCVAAADRLEHSGNKEALPKYESVLTFFGVQGLKKTAFIRALLPTNLKSYLKDGVQLDLTNKDSKVEALSAWIVELGELDSTFKKSDISALKAFLSRQEDDIRRQYAKAYSIMPRSTSFLGSVNEKRFLRDKTGNRRYLPVVVVGELCVPNNFDITDLWSFIWNEYKNGAQWWLTKDEEILQKAALEAHEDRLFEDLIQDEFDFDKPPLLTGLTGSDVLRIIHMNSNHSNNALLGTAMKNLGIKKDERLYLLPPHRKLLHA